MINNDELKYKLETVIEYLKDNGGYDYKLYTLLLNMQKMFCT